MSARSRAKEIRHRSIWPTPDQDRRPPVRRPEISLSQGAEWNALISQYIATIPLSGDAARAAEHIISGEPPSTLESSAKIAKVGAAAKDSQSAAPGAAALPPTL